MLLDAADGHGLWAVPGQRAVPAAHHHHRGPLHGEAGGRLEQDARERAPARSLQPAKECCPVRVCWPWLTISSKKRGSNAVLAGADCCCACGQADEPLGEFMDYCTYGHMIDNVVLIVTGTLHERDVHVRPPPPSRRMRLLLSVFSQSTLASDRTRVACTLGACKAWWRTAALERQRCAA